jgi:hypothetical protein
MLRKIERVSEAIRANPLARRLREELGPRLRSALFSLQMIFYRVRSRAFRSCASRMKDGIFPQFLARAAHGRSKAGPHPRSRCAGLQVPAVCESDVGAILARVTAPVRQW